MRGKIDEVVKDPVTAEKLKPRGYPIFARRPCLDSSYYETYNLPNVHLVDCIEDPILEITEKGVRTSIIPAPVSSRSCLIRSIVIFIFISPIIHKS